jgi:hypothetical protein
MVHLLEVGKAFLLEPVCIVENKGLLRCYVHKLDDITNILAVVQRVFGPSLIATLHGGRVPRWSFAPSMSSATP